MGKGGSGFPEDDAGIDATEAEGVGEDGLDGLFTAVVGDEVEFFEALIGLLEV